MKKILIYEQLYDKINFIKGGYVKSLNKKEKIYFLIMLILLIVSFILIRIDNNTCKYISLILFPFIIIFGFLMLKEDKK